MESSELQEGLFKAIQTIAKSEVNKMSFDKTLICTIKDNSNAARGEYYVTDNSSSFYAYSEVTTYLVGETVFVKVPNGDFNNQKHIEGRYVTKQGDDYNYVSPYTQFVSYTINLIDNPETEGELLANSDRTNSDPTIPTSDNTGPLWTASKFLQVNGFDYDTVYLKADFKSLLGSISEDDRQLLTGDYGLCLTMELGYLDSTGTEQYETKDFILSTKDMNGNPYDFETYYMQEKIFTLDNKFIKDGLRISNVSISFFQEGGIYEKDGEEFVLDPDKTKSFINLRGELVPWGFVVDDEWCYSENNLFVKNLDLQFGYKQEKVNTDKIAIYSRKIEGGYGLKGRNTKPLTYYSYLPETEKRALIEYDGLPEWKVEKNYDLYLADYNVKFIRIDKQNTFIEMLQTRTARELNLEYRLYKFVDPQYGVEVDPDPYAGENWELVAGPFPNDDWEYKFNPDITQDKAIFKLIVLYESPIGSEEVIDPVTGEILVPDTKHRRLDSEDLVFDLLGEVQKPSNEYLVINCDNDGQYQFYNLKGQLINSWEKNKKRYLYATKANSEATLRSITWTIPYKNTMIDPISADEFLDGHSERERGYQKDEEAGVINYTIYNPEESDFYFRIKEYLNVNNINNTIYCTASFTSGASYEVVAKTLEFGTIDFFGTEYKLDIHFLNGLNGIAVGEQQYIEIRVLNAQNEDITEQLIENGFMFDLEWFSKPEDSEMDYSQMQIKNNTYLFLLNAEDDVIYGKRVNEAVTRIRSTEDNEYLRIIEDTVGDQGDLNYTETRVLESGDQPITIPTDTRITEEGDIRRTEVNFSAVPDLISNFGSHIIRVLFRGNEDFEGHSLEEERILAEGYFPIPISGSNAYTTFQGPTQILYDSQGANPAYYKNPIKLYYLDINGTERENKDISWEIIYPAKSVIPLYHEFELTQPGNILKAPPILIRGRKCINIIAKSAHDNSILWIQPIPIFQDFWDDAILNSWHNTAIHSVVTGVSRTDYSGKLSGIFIGEMQDSDKVEDLERQKTKVLHQLTDAYNELNELFIELDILYDSGASDSQIQHQIALIQEQDYKIQLLEQKVAEINVLIESTEKTMGLYGVRNNDEVFFRLTEFGDFCVGNDNEIIVGYSESLIQSKDKTSILLDLKNNTFKFNHENLIIDPNDVDEAVVQTPGLKLYKNGLIESELDRVKFNDKEYKEETIVAKNRQGKTVYYRVLAQVLDNVLELQESDLFELQIDGEYLELQEE